MKLGTLVLRSLAFHWRLHLGVLLGAAVGTAVLTGALMVGDSVKYTLRKIALSRLGKIDLALQGNDRFFRESLADTLGETLEATVAPVIELRASVAAPGTGLHANQAIVRGVDPRFWELESSEPFTPPNLQDGVALNQRLADHLKVSVGDEILLRVENPSLLSRDAPLSTVEDQAVASRLRVKAVVSDNGLGRFDLGSSQIAPYNVFAPLSRLQDQINQEHRANLLLVGGWRSNPEGGLERAAQALRDHWRLEDAAHRIRELPDKGLLELMTDRIFLDAPIAAAARNCAPSTEGILTYFVNQLRLGNKATPYSIVSALEPPPAGGRAVTGVIPSDLRDDELIINDWLASDLGAVPGDSILMAYYTLGPKRDLIEATTTLRVRSVVPIEGAAYDPDLMPPFPGLHDSENCRDWDPGFPMKLGTIRDLDEEYWDRYKGTPKAFLNLYAGQSVWNNRFGNLTAIRFGAEGLTPDGLERSICSRVDPSSLGLYFVPIRERALAASSQALDFGLLFLGFSLFLIVAALLLMGLLYVFGVEHRSPEIGTLLAVGFTLKQVRKLLLAEGMILSVLGGAAGVVGGGAYAWGILRGLATLWRGAVGETNLYFHAAPGTLAASLVSGVFISAFAIGLATRKQAAQPARELLQGSACRPTLVRRAPGPLPTYLLAATLLAAAVLLSALSRGQGSRETAGTFFAAGAFLLLSGIAACRGLLLSMNREKPISDLSFSSLARVNSSRRLGRSLAIIGLLACGAFLVLAVEANRRSALEGADLRGSGTGGFVLLGESALPVYSNLNTESGLNHFGLSKEDLPGVDFVQIRVRDGDDASCLNLNRAQTPRVLGVDPQSLIERNAFSFVSSIESHSGESLWALLNRETGSPDNVPAIADQATVQWALRKTVGDRIDMVDERGIPFHLEIMATLSNSILQGNLMISENHFNARFPSQSGYRMFLVDVPRPSGDSTRETLSRALEDVGLDLVSASDRLADFNSVENTYLSIFQALGALGLLLGSAGLGVVVLRTALERRTELAVLRAVGFAPSRIRRLILLEHLWLLGLGLTCGAAAGFLSVLPAIYARGSQLPYAMLSVTLVGLAASGFIWVWLATRWALRGPLLAALRND